MSIPEIKELIRKHALFNAVKFNGRAKADAVLSKVLAEKPELKSRVKEIYRMVEEIVEDINSMSLEDQIKILNLIWPEAQMAMKRREEKKGLPPLPNAEKYSMIITRFAPNPDGPLHLGSARPIILNYEYSKMYKGKFILRFEDTDPRIKKPILHIFPDEEREYDYIRRDMIWLNVKWDEEYIQSDRLSIYYDYARKLIERKGAYVCTCDHSALKRYRDLKIACPHRDQSIEVNLELLDKMLSGSIPEGGAVIRVITDLKHPDPSIRDWIALRIIDPEKHPHPRVGDKYWVWPTYNFAAAIDDHLMKISHILRAKEHLNNTIKQSYIYKHFNWSPPEAIHFGRMNFEGAILSKSKIGAGIREGKYSGWDDPRLGTLMALRRRGILPEAIRELMLRVGVKPVSSTIAWTNLVAINKIFLEPKANRYMFIRFKDGRGKILIIEGVEKLVGVLPYHPSFPDRGYRKISLGRTPAVYIDYKDFNELRVGSELRLLGLANVRINERKGDKAYTIYLNDSIDYAKKKRLKIIQWVPVEMNVKVKVIKPHRIERGTAENQIKELNIGSIIQFIRYGFVRLDSKNGEVTFYYAHE